MWERYSDDPEQPGCVLMDNTTAYGALAAYEAWPASANEWTSGPLAVHLRSLMDVLEALVLHEALVLDSSSREEGVWTRFNWPGEEDVLVEHDFVWEGGFVGNEGDLVSGLVSAALETLDTKVAEGSLNAEMSRLYAAGVMQALPPFYESADHFGALLEASYGAVLSPETRRRLNRLAERLAALAQPMTNFAFFAFRAFYYQQLAEALGMSYAPHAWRSSLVAAELDAPTRTFTHYLQQVSGVVRSELESSFNRNFGGPALRGDFPLFASYIAHQASTRTELFEVAAEVRDSGAARNFRIWLAELESALKDQRDLPKLLQAQRELDTLVGDLVDKYGDVKASGRGLPITMRAGLPPFSAETTFQAKLPRGLRRLAHRRGHLVFLRDIVATSAHMQPFAGSFQRLRP